MSVLLISGNVREAWQGLNIMMSRASKSARPNCSSQASFTEELNLFFTRFNRHSTPHTWAPSTSSSDPPALAITEQMVTSVLGKTNANKAAGPDGLRGRVLKECSAQLGPVFTRLFQLLLDCSCVPTQLKGVQHDPNSQESTR